MSIFDLIAGMLFFNFITFGLYLAVVLICIDRRRQRQQIVDQHINRQRECHCARAEIPHEQSKKQAEYQSGTQLRQWAQNVSGQEQTYPDEVVDRPLAQLVIKIFFSKAVNSFIRSFLDIFHDLREEKSYCKQQDGLHIRNGRNEVYEAGKFISKQVNTPFLRQVYHDRKATTTARGSEETAGQPE